MYTEWRKSLSVYMRQRIDDTCNVLLLECYRRQFFGRCSNISTGLYVYRENVPESDGS